ncbi:hypothetical protein GCM10022408_30040 [Hymenobacter fastidiosus]|uniref:YncE family protein n=1 Tax=Hymenobacter fastidiosus TaxID=486264 RepID=A0ABP7SQ05_9BACT
MFPRLPYPALLTRLTFTGITALTLLGCDPKTTEVPVPEVRTNSVFIINEGTYNQPNGSVSVFDVAAAKVTSPDIFQAANGRPLLSNVTQSMTVVGQQGYIVANNSNKIEVVTLPSFKSVGTITAGLKLPRYLVAASADKAYVSEWVTPTFPTPGPGRVSVIDLRTNTVTRTIVVGKAPEEMLLAGGKLFVTNSEENTVTVINTATDVVETTLTVGPAPASLALDNNGRLWVLGNGVTNYSNPALSTKGSLTDFAPTPPYTVRKRDFASDLGYLARLRTNGTRDQFYVKTDAAVYRLSPADAALPTKPFLTRGSFDIYGLNIDPNDNTVYVGVAPTFTAPGKFIRYTSAGKAIDSAAVGIGPNGFIFY